MVKEGPPVKTCFTSLYAFCYFKKDVPCGFFGGAELQMHLMARGLAEDPHFKVSFIVKKHNGGVVERADGVDLYQINRRDYFSLWRILRRLNADIYIQRGANLETMMTALFCKLNKKVFLYMVANDEEVKNKKPSWMGGGAVGWLRWLIFQQVLKNTSAIFVQHERQRKDLKTFFNIEGIIRPSAHVIPEKNVTDNVEGKKFILWVGRNDPLKQPHLFINLAKLFPHETFIMIISDNQKMDIQETANLKILYNVPWLKTEKLFANAKLIINTSSSEGFPNTFIQAAKNKIPILSLLVNPDSVLDRFFFGKSFNGDFSALTSFLEKLLNDRNLWQEMSENAYRYAQNNHDLKRIIEEDKRIIKSLIFND